MGGQLLCFGRNNVGLCRNGKLLSTSFDISEWTNIVSFSVGQESIIGLCEDGSVKFTGGLTRYGKYDLDWQNVHKVYNFTNTVMAILNDGTVKSIGSLNEQGISDEDLYRNGWRNVTSIEEDLGIMGLREDGTLVLISDEKFIPNNDYKVIQIDLFNSWQSFSALIGLLSDGTVKVLHGSFPGGGELAKWTDIKTIMVNRNGIVGLRNDGSIVCINSPSIYQELLYEDVDFENWTGIEEIYTDGYLNILGLSGNGTVFGAGYIADPETNERKIFDLGRWTNIDKLYPGFCRIIGLRNNGTAIGVGRIDMGIGKGYKDIDLSSWENVESILDEGSCVLGYTEEGDVVGVGSLYSGKLDEKTPLVLDNWSNISCLYHECYSSDSDYILGLKVDGTVLATGIIRTGYEDGIGPTFDEVDLSDWTDIIYLFKNYNYIIGLRSDGTLVGCGDFDPEILKWDLW